MTKPHFKPEFRQEVAELVVEKNYSVREAAEAMGVGKSTVASLKNLRVTTILPEGVYLEVPESNS